MCQCEGNPAAVQRCFSWLLASSGTCLLCSSSLAYYLSSFCFRQEDDTSSSLAVAVAVADLQSLERRSRYNTNIISEEIAVYSL